MRAASVSNPQSFNLYAYCGNDPINRVDPSGLFWGKLFKWVSKALKWIAIAAVVATIIVATFATPGGPLAGTLLAKILAFIAAIPGAIGRAVSGISSTIAGIFSFSEVGTAVIAGLIGQGVLLGGSVAAGAIARNF